MRPQNLPVFSDLNRIVNASRSGSAIVTAPAGSGKTTLVPGAVLDDLPPDRKTILVQPRRLAARAVARRIALLRDSQLGQEVGYQVRFDRCATRDTRLLVVTTGVILRRLMDDLILDDIGAVILDEFHERSIEMDLVLGLLIRIRETVRPDLRILIMSATLDATAISAHLHHGPIIHTEGRLFPVEIHYEPRSNHRPLHERIVTMVPQAWQTTTGHVLVFLPGVGEIRRCHEELSGWAQRQDADLLMLYGDLSAEQQDHVLAESDRRKLILSTNVAETSLTIEGVTGVIDSGLARQSQMHPAVGLPRLERVPISRAAADQRAGRAGRTAAGHCWRLWDRAEHAARREQELPEIWRADLAPTLLQLLVCGERTMDQFPWLDAPPADAIDTARRLLLRLQAIDELDQVTPLGQQLARTPAHPRLARLLLAGAERGVLREAAIAAALLSERDPFRSQESRHDRPRDQKSIRSRSDLADRVAAVQAIHAGQRSPDPEWSCSPHAIRPIMRTAEQYMKSVDARPGERAPSIESALCQSLLDAFPDRLARLRLGSHDRGLMTGGRGVRLEASSRLRDEEFFLCLELNDGPGDARVRMASAVEFAWLSPSLLRTADELFFHPSRQQVEARRRTYFDDLLIEETPTSIVDPTESAHLLSHHAAMHLASILPDASHPASQFRARVAWLADRVPEWFPRSIHEERLRRELPSLCEGLKSLDDLRRIDWLAAWRGMVGYDQLAELDRLAPATLQVPSGNRISLNYGAGPVPILAVRIQEMFGLQETPRVAGGRVPVLLHLLGPNYRVQQVTDDLASFWQNTYPVVKKELRRRYPKHAWPDDPLAESACRSGLKPRRKS